MLFQRFAWDVFWRMFITQLCTLEPDQINKAQPCLFWQPKASNNLEGIPLCMIVKITTLSPPKVKLTHYLFTRMHSSDLDLRDFTRVQDVISIFVAFNWVITHLLQLINLVLQETSLSVQINQQVTFPLLWNAITNRCIFPANLSKYVQDCVKF